MHSLICFKTAIYATTSWFRAAKHTRRIPTRHAPCLTLAYVERRHTSTHLRMDRYPRLPGVRLGPALSFRVDERVGRSAFVVGGGGAWPWSALWTSTDEPLFDGCGESRIERSVRYIGVVPASPVAADASVKVEEGAVAAHPATAAAFALVDGATVHMAPFDFSAARRVSHRLRGEEPGVEQDVCEAAKGRWLEPLLSCTLRVRHTSGPPAPPDLHRLLLDYSVLLFPGRVFAIPGWEVEVVSCTVRRQAQCSGVVDAGTALRWELAGPSEQPYV